MKRNEPCCICLSKHHGAVRQQAVGGELLTCPTVSPDLRAVSILKVEGFELVVWRGADGLMRLEISSKSGRALIGLNHSWEGPLPDGRDRMTFTDNAHIIEDLTGDDYGRTSPSRLRRAAKDAVFSAWFRDSHSGKSPELVADKIEAAQNSVPLNPNAE